MVHKYITKFQKELIKNKNQNIRVVIEQVSAMPGQGVTSMFNFGQSFGILKEFVLPCSCPIYFIKTSKNGKNILI